MIALSAYGSCQESFSKLYVKGGLALCQGYGGLANDNFIYRADAGTSRQVAAGYHFNPWIGIEFSGQVLNLGADRKRMEDFYRSTITDPFTFSSDIGPEWRMTLLNFGIFIKESFGSTQRASIKGMFGISTVNYKEPQLGVNYMNDTQEFQSKLDLNNDSALTAQMDVGYKIKSWFSIYMYANLIFPTTFGGTLALGNGTRIYNITKINFRYHVITAGLGASFHPF